MEKLSPYYKIKTRVHLSVHNQATGDDLTNKCRVDFRTELKTDDFVEVMQKYHALCLQTERYNCIEIEKLSPKANGEIDREILDCTVFEEYVK